jgi:hypothetical protein
MKMLRDLVVGRGRFLSFIIQNLITKKTVRFFENFFTKKIYSLSFIKKKIAV